MYVAAPLPHSAPCTHPRRPLSPSFVAFPRAGCTLATAAVTRRLCTAVAVSTLQQLAARHDVGAESAAIVAGMLLRLLPSKRSHGAAAAPGAAVDAVAAAVEQCFTADPPLPSSVMAPVTALAVTLLWRGAAGRLSDAVRRWAAPVTLPATAVAPALAAAHPPSVRVHAALDVVRCSFACGGGASDAWAVLQAHPASGDPLLQYVVCSGLWARACDVDTASALAPRLQWLASHSGQLGVERAAHCATAAAVLLTAAVPAAGNQPAALLQHAHTLNTLNPLTVWNLSVAFARSGSSPAAAFTLAQAACDLAASAHEPHGARAPSVVPLTAPPHTTVPSWLLARVPVVQVCGHSLDAAAALLRSPAVRAWVASVAIAAGAWDDAVAMLTALMDAGDVGTSTVVLLRRLAYCQLQRSDVPAALAVCHRLLAACPTDIPGLMYRADAHLHAGRPVAALAALDAAATALATVHVDGLDATNVALGAAATRRRIGWVLLNNRAVALAALRTPSAQREARAALHGCVAAMHASGAEPQPVPTPTPPPSAAASSVLLVSTDVVASAATNLAAVNNRTAAPM